MAMVQRPLALPLLQLALTACTTCLQLVTVGSQGYEGPAACVGDVNEDGVSNVADVLALLAQFGTECGPDTCPDTGDVSDCSLLGDLNDDCRVSVDDLLLALGSYGQICECSTTASHRSTLSSVESLFPCESCVAQCYETFAEPNWDDPSETCEFIDSIYTTENHHECLNSCDHEILVGGFEVFLACHGGTAVVGMEGYDTSESLQLRAALTRIVDGNCWGGGRGGGVRTCVSDPYVIDAFASVPRHMFIPQTRPDCSTESIYGCAPLSMGYRDSAMRVGFGATISTPSLVAVMSQQLNVQPGQRVLEIGTGSGYQAAILVGMLLDVYTIEIVPDLKVRSTQWLTDLGYMHTGRLHTRLGDGYLGWPTAAPFDAIVVTCSPDHVPQPLKEQLKIGGKLVIPVGPDGGYQSVRVVTRTGEDEWENRFQFGVSFVPLQGDCVESHCESVEEHPVCPGQRFAVENAMHDYYHAGVVCSVDPCASAPPCSNGHVANPTCCSENVDGVPCVAVWRDDTSTLVACDGDVTPCNIDDDCPESEWCRATEHVALESHGHGHVRRQCVPYALPQRECGGYTLPWLFEKCAPGLNCVQDSAVVVDSPGTCQIADPCDDFIWATCTSDADCPGERQRCSSYREGCVPSSCNCDGTCTDDCITNVGVCESRTASCVVYEGCTDACAPINLPVCGADGITYANRCEAGCACMDIVSGGPC